MNSKTLFDKIWTAMFESIADGPDVLYIDNIYIHEVTSPQAFNGWKTRYSIFRPAKPFATPDHNIPTKDQHLQYGDQGCRENQVERLSENARNME